MKLLPHTQELWHDSYTWLQHIFLYQVPAATELFTKYLIIHIIITDKVERFNDS